ncbi:hypothetical protein [Acetobacterium sp. KB-1]|uniref:hypothetical protein n=1 Tax=Acetobacterium sp. KB-1 TaxID=2184575 RepID=UPI001FA93396|nr:hypothetical protein [Acetobacterium sp. KB-1]
MNPSTFANERRSHFWLDPRTKILMLLVVNIVLIGGGWLQRLIRCHTATFSVVSAVSTPC